MATIVELDTKQIAAAIPNECDTELGELMSMLSRYAWRRRLSPDVDTTCIFVEDDFHYVLPLPADRALLRIDTPFEYRPFVSAAWA
jgi:hypothetical protein